MLDALRDAWLSHSDLSTADLAVLTILVFHADKDGFNCHPSLETIAEYARLKRRTVAYSLKTLEQIGAIVREPRPPKATSYTVHHMHGAPHARCKRCTLTVHHMHGDSAPGAHDLPNDLPNDLSKKIPSGSPPRRKRKPASDKSRFGADARELAKTLYDALKAKDALPASKGWFARQAGIAENALLAKRPLQDWLDCLRWALEDHFWGDRLTSLHQLGDKVWPQYARREQKSGGEWSW